MLITWLNKLITNYNAKYFKKKNHYACTNSTLENFSNLCSEKDALFLCNIRSKQSNFLSSIIGKFSQYKENGKSAPLVHTIIIYYGNMVETSIGSKEISILANELYDYYENLPILSEIDLFVLGSADESGMNYFDFSTYQNREYSIYKLDINNYYDKIKIVQDLIHQYNRPYDAIGLFFWPIYKIFKFLGFLDDSKSWFCSEICYDILKRNGIKISDKDNPSPADIEKYLHKQNLPSYRTEGFLD